MVVGVVAILFGVLGALASVGGTVSVFFSRSMAGMPGQEEMIAVQAKYLIWTLTHYATAAILAVLLAVGGSILVRRRIVSRKILVTWACLKIPLVIVSTAVGFMVQREMFAVMMKASASGRPNPAFAAPMMESFAVIGIAIALVWGWALPIFLLVWFNRAVIRSEVAAWR